MTKIKYCVWDMGGVLCEWSEKPFYDWCYNNTQDLEAMKKNINKMDYNIHMSALEDEVAFAKSLCDCYDIQYRMDIEKEINKVLQDGKGPDFEISQTVMNSLLEQGV